MACRLGYLDIVSVLTPYSQINLQDEFGNTALHYACEKGHLLIAKLILANKATEIDLNFENEECVTPLWLAASGGHAELVWLFLERGAQSRQCV